MKQIFIAAIFLCLASQITMADEPTYDLQLRWNQTALPNLPGKIGFGGPISGTHNGALIVAGGANFPKGPPWPVNGKPAGTKVWYDQIYVLEKPTRPQTKMKWLTSSKLPRPLAYAPAVSIAEGMVILGGETYGKTIDQKTNKPKQGNFATRDVLLLTWYKDKKKITIDRNSFPPLPKASSYHGAAVSGKLIYVIASHAKTKTSRRLDSKSFWMLDSSKPVKQRKWISLTPWPGAPRHKTAFAVQKFKSKKQFTNRPCLYLISGSTWVNDKQGNPDLSKFEFFTDSYRYSPKLDTWTRIADLPVVKESRNLDLKGYQYDRKKNLWIKNTGGKSQLKNNLDDLFKNQPRAAVASPAIHVGSRHILVFSGDTGRMVSMENKDRANFPPEVLSYDTNTNRWSVAGKMPQPVVTANAVWWNNQIVIPSGEIRPAVRTPKVQALKINNLLKK